MIQTPRHDPTFHTQVIQRRSQRQTAIIHGRLHKNIPKPHPLDFLIDSDVAKNPPGQTNICMPNIRRGMVGNQRQSAPFGLILNGPGQVLLTEGPQTTLAQRTQFPQNRLLILIVQAVKPIFPTPFP